jgi:hypothetical protein
MSVEGDYTVSANGDVGIPGIGSVGVGTEVARKYGVTYGQEQRLSRSVTVSAKEGTNMVHTIQQYEYWETGEVVISVGNQNLRLPYSFRRDFGIELVNSRNEDNCPTNPTAVQPTLLPSRVPPTPTPPTPIPPTPTFDVFDDFSSSTPIPGGNWGNVEGNISPTIQNGSLHLNYTSSGGYGGGGVHISNNNRQLKLVATELVVNSAKAKSYTFMQVFLGVIDGKPWYANFGIMDTGELFYASAPMLESPKGVEKIWASKGLGNPNVLVVEWIGEDVRFSANNQVLHDVKARDGGWWVIFGVGAEGNGSSTNEFRWAGWSYRS